MYTFYMLSLAVLASSVIAVPDIYKFHYSVSTPSTDSCVSLHTPRRAATLCLSMVSTTYV